MIKCLTCEKYEEDAATLIKNYLESAVVIHNLVSKIGDEKEEFKETFNKNYKLFQETY